MSLEDPDEFLNRLNVLRQNAERYGSQVLSADLARTIAREYAHCAECSESLAGDISGGKEVDRDVDISVECGNCGQEQRVSIEEKVWGLWSTDNRDEIPGAFDVYEVDGQLLSINPYAVSVTPLF